MENQGQITLNDFATAVNLIDICTERGSFKGNELLIVGQLREKFSNFVRANAQEPMQEPEKTSSLEQYTEEQESE